MVQTIKVTLRKKDKLVVNLDIDLKANSKEGQQQLVAGDGLKCASKARQRFHLRNYVHYGNQVNLGHHHANSVRANKRQLLRSPVVEQPADLLEQIVVNRAKMIEMHAF